MTALLDVILPVFVVIGFGYAAARAGLFGEAAFDGIMRYAQSFALPVLLFRSIAGLDLASAFQPGVMLSFYIGAFSGFALGFGGAHFGFRRPLAESVAVGFACLFSNSLLLGIPITERAYGAGALQGNIAIISIHAPVLYTFGIVAMEWARSSGTRLALARQVLRGVFTQPLVIGILCGFAVNLSGVALPSPLTAAAEMVARSGLPVALFGLGGILFRYRPEGDGGLIALICVGSLVVHPVITYTLGRWVFALDSAGLRSAVVTAAMAPGVNAYMFAHLYGTGRRVVATAVLFATALSIFTTWGWLHLLP